MAILGRLVLRFEPRFRAYLHACQNWEENTTY
ncbi:MAG: hypothetical protein RLZZ337_263 [Bacteroidota bacterium]|jgi:hypothetical protein